MTISIYTSTGDRLASSAEQSVDRTAERETGTGTSTGSMWGEATTDGAMFVDAADSESTDATDDDLSSGMSNATDAADAEPAVEPDDHPDSLSDARSWFSHDVTAVLEPGGEIIVRVRARERPQARLDTYFVRYDGPAHTLESELARFLQEECGFEYVDDASVEYATVAENLSVRRPRWPSDAPAIDILDQVVADGHVPMLTVSDHATAGKLAHGLADHVDAQIVISDVSGEPSPPPSADIAIGVSANTSGTVEPTDRTRSHIEAIHDSRHEARIDQQRDAIREAVRTLRHDTDLTDREVRRLVEKQAPAEPASSPFDIVPRAAPRELLVGTVTVVFVLAIAAMQIVGGALPPISSVISAIPRPSLSTLAVIGGVIGLALLGIGLVAVRRLRW